MRHHLALPRSHASPYGDAGLERHQRGGQAAWRQVGRRHGAAPWWSTATAASGDCPVCLGRQHSFRPLSPPPPSSSNPSERAWQQHQHQQQQRHNGEGKSPPAEAARTTTSSRDDVSISNASELEVTEWVIQDEPGVYITVRELADGTRELRRVRFSRERFAKLNAKLWWEENKERIQAQYL